MKNVYNGSEISQGQKEKRGFFYIEELFTGNFPQKAPISLRKKVNKEIIQNIETNVNCFFGVSSDTKIIFKDYKHFRRTIDEIGIPLKQYLK